MYQKINFLTFSLHTFKATNLLESLFGVVVNANMYLTPYGAHQAFDSHFDWMDGIIVQVMGCKKWKIYTSPTASRPLPDTVFKLNQNYDQQIKNSQRQERGSNFDNAFETFDLRSGSLLYIPRGFAHEAATNCSNIDKINYKNKRSQDNKENVDDDGSTLNAGHAVDIAANVASLHITFGLEVATDSTVEIYLHHYILIYFNSINTASTESTKSSIRLCSDKFSNGRGYSRTIIDGMLRIDNNSESTIHESNDIHNSRNDEKSKDASSQMNSSDFLLDMENTFVLLQNGSHKLTFQIGNLTNNDLIHLILHVATTIDSSYAKEKHGTHKNTQKSYDNEVNDERNNDNELKSVRSDVLRQGVAITTFTSKNKYQSMLHQILPEALVYLKDFFTFYTMDFIITEALLLAFRMNMIDANIEKIVVDFDSRKDEEGYGFISEEGSDVISVSGDDQINDVSNFAKKNENNKENTNINNSGNKDRNNDGNDRNKNKNDGKMTGRKLDPFKIPEYIRYFLSSSNRSMINPSYTARQKIRNVCQESHELSDMNLNASERRDIILNIQDSKWRFINPKKSVNLKLFSKVKSIIEKILMSLHDHDAENRDEWTGADDTEKNESEKEFSDHLYCMAWKSMISKLRNDRLSRS
jgi:ribosomal protein L16 Arg81 hydroxylase